MTMGSKVFKRQAPLDPSNGNNNGHNGYGYNGYDGQVNWWWTPAGMATRYGICAILFLIILAFFVGGYYHAQRRIRRGQQPLAYHRWMVRRAYYPPPPQAGYPGNPQDPYNQSYGMEGYPPPPPAYANAEAPPPVYQPPQGGTKAMADQNFGGTNRAGEGSRSAGVGSAPAASMSR